jgi:hypothetical protein
LVGRGQLADVTDTTIETTKELLRSLLEETDDGDVHYKLRTALQLIEIHEDNLTRLEEVAGNDDELAERLANLGYID